MKQTPPTTSERSPNDGQIEPNLEKFKSYREALSKIKSPKLAVIIADFCEKKLLFDESSLEKGINFANPLRTKELLLLNDLEDLFHNLDSADLHDLSYAHICFSNLQSIFIESDAIKSLHKSARESFNNKFSEIILAIDRIELSRLAAALKSPIDELQPPYDYNFPELFPNTPTSQQKLTSGKKSALNKAHNRTTLYPSPDRIDVYSDLINVNEIYKTTSSDDPKPIPIDMVEFLNENRLITNPKSSEIDNIELKAIYPNHENFNLSAAATDQKTSLGSFLSLRDKPAPQAKNASPLPDPNSPTISTPNNQSKITGSSVHNPTPASVAVNATPASISNNRITFDTTNFEPIPADQAAATTDNNITNKGIIATAALVGVAGVAAVGSVFFNTDKKPFKDNKKTPEELKKTNEKTFEKFKEKIQKSNSDNTTVILNYDELNEFNGSDYSNATKIVFYSHNRSNNNLTSSLILNRTSLQDPFEARFISEVDGASSFYLGYNQDYESTYKSPKERLGVLEQNQLDDIIGRGLKVDQTQIVKSEVLSSKSGENLLSKIKDHLKSLYLEEKFNKDLVEISPQNNSSHDSVAKNILKNQGQDKRATTPQYKNKTSTTNPLNTTSLLKLGALTALSTLNGSGQNRNIFNLGGGGNAPYQTWGTEQSLSVQLPHPPSNSQTQANYANGEIKSYTPYISNPALSAGQSSLPQQNHLLPPMPSPQTTISSQTSGSSYLVTTDFSNFSPALGEYYSLLGYYSLLDLSPSTSYPKTISSDLEESQLDQASDSSQGLEISEEDDIPPLEEITPQYTLALPNPIEEITNQINQLPKDLVKIDVDVQNNNLKQELVNKFQASGHYNIANVALLVGALFKVLADSEKQSDKSGILTKDEQEALNLAEIIGSQINKAKQSRKDDLFNIHEQQIEKVKSALNSKIIAKIAEDEIQELLKIQSQTEELKTEIKTLKTATEASRSTDKILTRIIKDYPEWEVGKDYLKEIIPAKLRQVINSHELNDVKNSRQAQDLKTSHDSEVEKIREEQVKYSRNLLPQFSEEEENALRSPGEALKTAKLELEEKKYASALAELENEKFIQIITSNIKKEAKEFTKKSLQEAEEKINQLGVKTSDFVKNEANEVLDLVLKNFPSYEGKYSLEVINHLNTEIPRESQLEEQSKEKIYSPSTRNHTEQISLLLSNDQKNVLSESSKEVILAESEFNTKKELHAQRVSSLYNLAIEQLAAFEKFETGVEKSISGIKDKISTLAEKIKNTGTNVENTIFETITNHRENPLSSGETFLNQEILKEIIELKLLNFESIASYKFEKQKLLQNFKLKKLEAKTSIPLHDLRDKHKSYLTEDQEKTHASKIESYRGKNLELAEKKHELGLLEEKIESVVNDILQTLPETLSQVNNSIDGINLSLSEASLIQSIDPELQAQDPSSHLANLHSLLPKHVAISHATAYVGNLLESAKTAEGFKKLVAQQELEKKELEKQKSFIETEISTLQRIYQANSQSPTLEKKLRENVDQSKEQIDTIKANLKIRHENERLDKQEEIARIQINENIAAVEKFKEAVANSTAIKTSEFKKQIGETKVVDIKASALEALQKAKDTHPKLTEEILIRLIDEKFENRVSEEKRKSIRDEAEGYIQNALLVDQLLHPIIPLDRLTEDQKLLLSESEKTGFENSREALADLPRTLYKKKAQEKIDNLEIELLTESVNEQLAFDQAAANNALQQYSIIQNAITISSKRISELKSEPSLDLQFKSRFPDLTNAQKTALIQEFSDPDSDANYTTEKGRITAAHRIELKSTHIQSVINGLIPSQVELLPSDQFELLKSDVVALQKLEKELSDRELDKKITDLTLEWRVGKANEILDQINFDISVRTKAIIEKSEALQTQLDENLEFDVDAGIAKIIAKFPKLLPKGKDAATVFSKAQFPLISSNRSYQADEVAPIENYRKEILATKSSLSDEQKLLGTEDQKLSFQNAEDSRHHLSLKIINRRLDNNLVAIKFRYLSQVVDEKITDNFRQIADLIKAAEANTRNEAEDIQTKITNIAIVRPQETAIENVSTFISGLEITEPSKERLSEIYTGIILAKDELEDAEPTAEVIEKLQKSSTEEKQQNAKFVEGSKEGVGKELTPFLTQDSLKKFESFKESLNEKTDLLYRARYNQAKNDAIAKNLSDGIIGQIKDDINLLDLSLVGAAPKNCDNTIKSLREGILETKAKKINKEETALAKAKEVYPKFGSLSSEEQERLTTSFKNIINETNGSILENQTSEIKSQANKRLVGAQSTNSDLIKEFSDNVRETRKSLLTNAKHQKWLTNAKLFLDSLAKKLHAAEIDTEINNLEAEALATNVKTRIENDLATIENSKNVRQEKIDNIAKSLEKLDELAAIEDTTFEVTLKSHRLFNEPIPEETLKEIIGQELKELKSDSAYKDDVDFRQNNHQTKLDRIKARKFSPEPTAQEKSLFTDAMKTDFDNQTSQFKDRATDLREKSFRIKSAKKDAESLTDRVNTRLKKDIPAVENFIKVSAEKIESSTNSLAYKISVIEPIDVEKSTFDTIKNSGQFNFLQSGKLPNLLKDLIASKAEALAKNEDFKKEQELLIKEYNPETVNKIKIIEVEKLRNELTPNDLLLLDGSEEFKSFEEKFAALKDLESEFSAKQLAAKLEEHKTDFLTKSTSENLTKIFEIAVEGALKEKPSTKEELQQTLHDRLSSKGKGSTFDSNMITNALLITLLLQNWYLSQSTNDNKSKTSVKTSTIPNPKPSTSLTGIAKIIPLVNRNAEEDKEKTNQANTHHTADWNNNKKLLNVLKKVADCDFDKLKEALNSKENRNHKLLQNLNLTSGDLAVLDAIDELHDTERARDNFTAKNSKRENLKEFMGLIPKNDRKKFFEFDKNNDVELRITKPSNNPSNTTATKLEKIIRVRA